MNEQTKAYFAAMIDAEGVVGFWRTKSKGINAAFPWNYVPRAMVTNSHFGLIRFLHTVSGRGCAWQSKSNPTNPNWSPIHRWQIVSRDCRELIAEIFPYLVVKRRQAELVLAFPVRHFRRANNADLYARQTAMFDECAVLNTRGLKDTPETEFPADHPLLTPHGRRS